MQIAITHVDLNDPSIGFDEEGREYELLYIAPTSYCGRCGKIFDLRDVRYGCCVDCTYDD